MALTAEAVRVGVTGAVYVAASGATLPTDAITAVDAAFSDVGYVSEEGVTTSTGTESTDIKAWQNGDIVRKVQTSHDFTVAFTMLETNGKSLELYYGNYTAGPGGASGVVEVKGEQGYRGSFVINVLDVDDDIRIVIPDGQVTERGDVVYVNGDAITYPVTITCYPDANGDKARIYFDTSSAS